MRSSGKHKSETGIEALDKAASEITKLADEVLEEKVGKAEPPKEAPALPLPDGRLLQMASEFSREVNRQIELMLGAIEILLAGADYLSWDTVGTLHDARGTLQGGMQTEQLKELVLEDAAKDAEDAAIDADEADEAKEAANDAEDTVDAVDSVEQIPVSESDVANIEKHLSIWQPMKQVAILRKIADRMPDKVREYNIETACDKARDNFLNYLLNNRSDEEQTAIYEGLLVAAKSDKGIVELKATA